MQWNPAHALPNIPVQVFIWSESADPTDHKRAWAAALARETGAPVAFTLSDRHRDGYTVGGGLEYMFAPNWSAKAEYQYYNFGDSRFVTPAVLVPFGSFHNDEHTVKAGINYRFNWGPGPVVAKY